MKRVVLAAMSALVAVGLVGCAQLSLLFGLASNETPVVNVAKGAVTGVTPDPLHFGRGETNVRITWQLASGYRFAANGISIDGELIGGLKGRLEPRQTEILECMPNEDRTRYTCLNKNSRPGVYKYTVRLVMADGNALTPFDPHIFNE